MQQSGAVDPEISEIKVIYKKNMNIFLYVCSKLTQKRQICLRGLDALIL